MANISFMLATEHRNQFNRDEIAEMLGERFPNTIKLVVSDQWDQIDIINPNTNNTITKLYFNEDCYCLEIDNDIQYLTGMIEEAQESNDSRSFQREHDLMMQIEGLERLKKMDIDWNNDFIQYTHSPYFTERELKSEVEQFLHGYFKAFIFDEGVHPEYMSPTYGWRTKEQVKKDDKDMLKRAIIPDFLQMDADEEQQNDKPFIQKFKDFFKIKI